MLALGLGVLSWAAWACSESPTEPGPVVNDTVIVTDTVFVTQTDTVVVTDTVFITVTDTLIVTDTVVVTDTLTVTDTVFIDPPAPESVTGEGSKAKFIKTYEGRHICSVSWKNNVHKYGTGSFQARLYPPESTRSHLLANEIADSLTVQKVVVLQKAGVSVVEIAAQAASSWAVTCERR